MPVRIIQRTLLMLFVIGTHVRAEEFKKPLFDVVDLNVGGSADLTLSDGSKANVKVVDLNETRDSVCFAVRQAVVTVEVNGKTVRLTSATYNLPQTVGGVQIDCPVTRGYNKNGSPEFWGLDQDVRLRLWPAHSPLLKPDSFIYPVKQKWFATDTQMANDPVHVDGGDQPGERKIYYHSGLDIGGSEGLVEVIAATDALVVSSGDVVLEGHRKDTPVAPRYDVVYLRDELGWYYRYSHLKSFDPQIVPGRIVKQGDRIGWLGKEGGSGGWSHLHFEIKARQPSGKWGTQEGYAFLWEAYQRQFKPKLIAVARPHHVAWVGDEVTLDGSKSWSKAGGQLNFEWQFADGSKAVRAQARRSYSQPGRYSEVLRVTDAVGNVAYDFAVVIVADRQHPERRVPSIHPNYFPTQDIQPGDAVTFKVRTFNTTAGKEAWDFGDGSPQVEVQSDGNAVKLATDGYAVTTHRFEKPGDYVARVTRTNEFGFTATGHLHVHVESSKTASTPAFEWAISAGGSQHDKTRGIAVDPQGNVLLTGEFTGTATFGEQSLTAVGSMDFFVAKVDASGKFLWVRSGGGDKIDRGYAVACDHVGNCYVTGHYESASAKFDQRTIESVGDYDLFVAKYDSNGKLLWLETGGGKGYDYGHGIAADKFGNVFVTGAIVGEGTFAAEPIGQPGPAHVFCLAMNSGGKLNWSRTADGKGASSGHAIAVDQQGHCYVGGYAGGDSTFGGQRLTTPTGHDILVARFDAKGNLIWLHEGHGSPNAMIHELMADTAGNVWASGMFQGELKLADRTVASQGQHDLLLTSFDTTGRRLWTKTAGGAGIDYGLGVTTDGHGNSYLTGSFTGRVEFDETPQNSSTAASDIMIVKYDRAGMLHWFRQAGSDRTDHAYTIVSDHAGNLYLSGACSGAAKFGDHSIPNRGSNDVFLAKLRDRK